MNVYPLTFESKVIYAPSGLKEQMSLFSTGHLFNTCKLLYLIFNVVAKWLFLFLTALYICLSVSLFKEAKTMLVGADLNHNIKRSLKGKSSLFAA